MEVQRSDREISDIARKLSRARTLSRRVPSQDTRGSSARNTTQASRPKKMLEVEPLRHSRPQPVATSRLRPQRESTSVRTNRHRNVPQARGGAGSSHHVGAEDEQREEPHQH